MVQEKGVIMSIELRIMLIVGAVLMMAFVLWKIRKSQLFTSDAIFWFLLSAAFVIAAIFPQIVMIISDLLGVVSPANLVFLVIIAILFIKELLNTMQISKLRIKLETAVQKSALERNYLNSKECEEVLEDDR